MILTLLSCAIALIEPLAQGPRSASCDVIGTQMTVEVRAAPANTITPEAQDTGARQKKPDPIVPPLDKDALIAHVDALAKAAIEKEGVPGLTIAIAEKDRIVYAQGYGYADAARNQPAKDDTRYPIGSLTRQFTAVAVLQLIDDKKLALEDPLEKVLPGFPVGDHKVTVQHLLSNTSGIPTWERLLAKHPELATRELTNEQFLATFRDVPFEFEPGADFRLDSANYSLLSMIVAKVSGEPFGDYVTKHILEPIGLNDTRFCPAKENPISYASDCKTLSEDSELSIRLPGTPAAATQSLCSTAADLIAWQSALVQRAVFSERASRLIMTPTTLPDGNSTNYGYAIRMSRLGEFKNYSHTGGVGGFRVRSSYYSLPHYTIVVLSNCATAPVERIERDVARFLLGIPSSPAAEVELPEPDAKLVAGTYQIATTQIRVAWQDGKLWWAPPIESKVRLIHLGGLVFAFDNDRDARLTFTVVDGKATGFTVMRGGYETKAKRMD